MFQNVLKFAVEKTLILFSFDILATERSRIRIKQVVSINTNNNTKQKST